MCKNLPTRCYCVCCLSDAKSQIGFTRSLKFFGALNLKRLVLKELHSHGADPDVTYSFLSERSMVVDRHAYHISCYCCCEFGVNNVFRKKENLATNRDAPLDPHASEDVWWTVTVFLIAFQSCISLSKTAAWLPWVLP